MARPRCALPAQFFNAYGFRVFVRLPGLQIGLIRRRHWFNSAGRWGGQHPRLFPAQGIAFEKAPWFNIGDYHALTEPQRGTSTFGNGKHSVQICQDFLLRSDRSQTAVLSTGSVAFEMIFHI